jgi:hypothetical protein
MKKLSAERIEAMLEHFDFVRLHHALLAINWQWSRGAGTEHVPDVSEMKRAARDLLQNVGDTVVGSRTGGFNAYISHDEFGEEIAYLTFELGRVSSDMIPYEKILEEK